MIIGFTLEKYRKDGKGIHVEVPDLLEKLSTIVDIEHSEFPSRWKETEDGKGYRKEKIAIDEFFKDREKKLIPGDVFVYDGQIFAIEDEKTLCLRVSETGGKAAFRFVDEILNPEYEIAIGKDRNSIENVKVSTDIDICYITDKKFEHIKLPFYISRFMNQRCGFIENGGTLAKTIKAEFEDSNVSFCPVTIYITTQNGYVWFDPEEIFDEQAEFLASDFLTWAWNNYRYERTES